MDDSLQPTPKRVWFKVPKIGTMWKSQWVGRPIDDCNKTARNNIHAPKEFVGNGHVSWDLFYHEEVVNELVVMLKRVRNHAGLIGTEISKEEIDKLISFYGPNEAVNLG